MRMTTREAYKALEWLANEEGPAAILGWLAAEIENHYDEHEKPLPPPWPRWAHEISAIADAMEASEKKADYMREIGWKPGMRFEEDRDELREERTA